MFSFHRKIDDDDRIFEAPTLAEAERLRHLAATEDGAVVGDIYTEQRFSCGACRYSFRIGVRVPVRPYTECPECGWLEAAAVPDAIEVRP